MYFIDTHAHVYLPEFDPDRASMIELADKEGVTKIIQPAIDSTTHEMMLETEKNNPGRCFSMMGLHPCSVKGNYKEELETARGYLAKRKFTAIGEIGIDLYWDLTYTEQQYTVFKQQIEWALEFNLPIVIHSRNAVDECISVVEKYQNGQLRGVFHCFSGNREQAEKIIGLGLYLGIGGVVTFKNSGLDKVMETIGLEHVVLETDSPYLAPVPFRGKRNECSYIRYVAKKLAEIKKMGVEEIAEITSKNAEKLFRI